MNKKLQQPLASKKIESRDLMAKTERSQETMTVSQSRRIVSERSQSQPLPFYGSQNSKDFSMDAKALLTSERKEGNPTRDVRRPRVSQAWGRRPRAMIPESSGGAPFL